MALSGNPKKMAQNIADGYFMLTPPMLRAYSPADFKNTLANLTLVSRELRQDQIPLEDINALKTRNMKLTRLHQAEVVLRSFCKKRRTPL